MTKGPPEGYVDVAARIRAFYDKFPEGRLRRQGEPEVTEIAGSHFVVYTALAFRDADDKLPGMGTAWEPFPGPTPFTKDSELMNAETAAWGRAIASLGFEVHQGIATAEDVRNRSGETPKVREGSNIPSVKQLGLIEKLARELGADDETQQMLVAYSERNLTGGREGSASKAIDKLMDSDKGVAGEALARFVVAASAWNANLAEVPVDTEGLDVPEAA